MIEVVLYSREDCHLCHQVEEELQSLQNKVPHKLKVVDVDSSPALRRKYGFEVPVVEIGPYMLRAPINQQDLEISLSAYEHIMAQEQQISEDISAGRLSIPKVWSANDSLNLWLSRHWLKIFNLIIVLYLGGAFLPAFFLNAGLTQPANVLYRVYSFSCHQYAYRSWFLFGEQTYYPLEGAHFDDLLSYEEAIGLPPDDFLAARAYHGDELLGFKVALCQRDVAIYLGVIIFGLLFGLLGQRFIKLPWYLWIIIAIAPIGIDGFSQLFSQPPFSWLPYRESVPLLRSITGFLFGFGSAWFGYPVAADGMRETRQYMEGKLERYRTRQAQ